MTSACFHCALPVPSTERHACLLLGQIRLFCCAGCQAVAQTIVDCGCADYYQHRLQPATSLQSLGPALPDLEALDHPAVKADFVQHQGAIEQAELTLAGLTCTACSWLIEHRLMQLPGIEQAAVNFSTQRLLVRFDERISPSRMVSAIRDIGYQAYPYVAYEHEILLKKTAKIASRRLALAGLGAMQAMMFALGLYLGERQGMTIETRDYLRFITFLVSTPVVTYAGWPFYRQAILSLRHRHLSMDVPLTLAVLSAYLASTWAMITHHGDTYFDSISMLIFFVTASRYLETRARLSAGEIHANIQALTPKLAWLLDGEHTQRVASTSLKVGDKVRVLPGENLPCDGKILVGHSLIEESLLTGESLPLEKGPQDLVIAGSQNLDQTLTLEVTAVGTATVLAGLERLLNRAQAEKPHAAQLADRIAGWLIAGILIATVATYSYWHLHHSEHAFWYALAVLIVTCPCALALAVPTAWTISTTTLAKQGFLIGRGHVLETLQHITTVLFDKTGTLTEGPLKVVQIIPVTISAQQALDIACSLEAYSEHPIARAFSRENRVLHAVDKLIRHPSLGLEGDIHEQTYRLGRPDFACPLHALPADSDLSLLWLALGDEQGQVLAWLGLQDRLRPDAYDMIKLLQDAGLKTGILSGDREGNVARVAHQLGMTDFAFGLSASDKLQILQTRQRQGEVILMVGDGINDAPVLAGAHLSLAMGRGTDLAHAAADALLLDNQLISIPRAYQQARRTKTIVVQNLLWAIGYNLIMVPLAAMGYIPPWLAALGMSLSSLLVVGNALRLRGSA